MFSITAPHASPLSLLRSRSTGLASLAALWRSRRALAQLEDDRLDDIGLTARDAAAEARRPLWDVPGNWRG